MKKIVLIIIAICLTSIANAEKYMVLDAIESVLKCLLDI